jgi:hypothetical protein
MTWCFLLPPINLYIWFNHILLWLMLFSIAWMCRLTSKASNIGWWQKLLGFRRLEVPRLSELLDLQVMMHITYLMHCTNIWCIVHWYSFCPRPIVVPHLRCRRWPRCIILHPIPMCWVYIFHLWYIVEIWRSIGNLSFLRTIVSYVTYVSSVSNWHDSHALRMWIM